MPAVVDEETWKACNAILAANKAGRKPAKLRTYLFSGLARCACGTKMYVPSGSKKYVCKSCRHKIPIDTLEEIFRVQLKGFILSPEALAAHLSQADQLLTDKQELIRTMEREAARLTHEMEQVYKLYLDEAISPQGFKERYSPLEERRDELTTEMPKLQGEIDIARIQHLSSAEIISEARDLYTRWEALAFGEKRTIVENIVESIVVGKEEISIDLTSPVSLDMPTDPRPTTPSFSTTTAQRDRNHMGSSRRPG